MVVHSRSNSRDWIRLSMVLLFKLSAETKPAMPRSDPASLKWDNDGELSSQDTFNWV